MPEVSIIVVNWNGLRYLAKCLNSLYNQSYKDFEVILVDNSSKDGSVEYVEQSYPNIKIIKNSQNLGFAKGVNQGVSNSKGKYIALLNNDAVAHKNWLYFLVKTIESNSSYGSVSSASYNRYGKDRYFFAPGTSGFFGQNVLFKNYKYPKDRIIDVFGMAGGACIFRNQRKNVFDSDYFAYSEDTAFGWLMRIKGHHNKLNANSVVYHEGEVSGKRLKSKKIFLQERNRLLNVFIYYQWSTLLKLLPLFLLNLITIYLVDLKNIIPRTLARLWLLINIPLILKKRKQVQLQRKVSDKEIIRYMGCKFYEEELVYNPVLKRIVIILNKLQMLYCTMFRIKTIEFVGTGFATV